VLSYKKSDRENRDFLGISGASGYLPRAPPPKQHQTGSFSSLFIALFNQKSGICGYFEYDVFQSLVFVTLRWNIQH
jgi:hypothetical protein